MRVSDDVMELVALLNEEGFGPLAGELLAEISLGREVEDDFEPDSASGSDKDSAGKDAVFAEDAVVRREPIPEHQQLNAAVAFLRLSLVEPIRRMAEAETIAGELARGQDLKVPARAAGQPVRIVFRPLDGDGGQRFERFEAAGETATADALDEVLSRLVRQVI